MIAQRDARAAAQSDQALSEKTESIPKSSSSTESTQSGLAAANPKPRD
jgi:hypothetical protein